MKQSLILILAFVTVFLVSCDSLLDPTGTSRYPESNAPVLLAPENGAQGLASNVLLKWNKIGDINYRVQLSTAQNFSSSTIDTLIDASQLELTQLNQNTTYYWRVKATSAKPNADAGEATPAEIHESDWSDVWNFTTSTDGTSEDGLESDIWVGAYLGSWNHYAPPTGNWGNLPTEEIDWDAFTHMYYFAFSAQSDGTLSTVADYENLSPDRLNAIVPAAHENNVPILFTVGGWGNYDGFSNAIRPGNRDNFISNLIDVMVEWNFDGIDLDMEPIQDSDVSNYIDFVKELHDTLSGISTPMKDQPLLTAAIMGSHEYMFASLADYFDQINLMTYDYSGSWEGWISWHNSPIYSGGNTFPNTAKELPSIENTLTTFLDAGIPAGKLGIGIDFYGYVWHGHVDSPLQDWSTPPNVEDNVPYYEIMNDYYTEDNYYWDLSAGAAYISISNSNSSQNKFVSYDDKRAVSDKIKFAREKGIGGTIIWELGGGYRENQPAGQKDPLLQSVKNALLQ